MSDLDPTTRNKLLAAARATGVSEAEAEECLQEALLALSREEPAPENPGGFLYRAVRRRALDMRKAASIRVKNAAAAMPETNAARMDLDAIENLLSVDGAIENLIMWGGTGSTKRLVPSLADVDPRPLQAWLAYCLAVIDELPRTDRHKQRLREKFAADIRAALDRSGYELAKQPRLDVETVELGAIASSTTASTRRRRKRASRRGTVLLTDGTLNRGALLARRLVPELSFEDAYAIAMRASKSTDSK